MFANKRPAEFKWMGGSLNILIYCVQQMYEILSFVPRLLPARCLSRGAGAQDTLCSPISTPSPVPSCSTGMCELPATNLLFQACFPRAVSTLCSPCFLLFPSPAVCSLGFPPSSAHCWGSYLGASVAARSAPGYFPAACLASSLVNVLTWLDVCCAVGCCWLWAAQTHALAAEPSSWLRLPEEKWKAILRWNRHNSWGL